MSIKTNMRQALIATAGTLIGFTAYEIPGWYRQATQALGNEMYGAVISTHNACVESGISDKDGSRITFIYDNGAPDGTYGNLHGYGSQGLSRKPVIKIIESKAGDIEVIPAERQTLDAKTQAVEFRATYSRFNTTTTKQYGGLLSKLGEIHHADAPSTECLNLYHTSLR